MIELHNVVKRYRLFGEDKTVTVIDGVNLSVKEKLITVLKGDSGAGKTTLLSLIGAISRPTSGRIIVNNEDITSLPEKFLSKIRRTTFGFIFQHYNLIRGISTLENVMIPSYTTEEDPKIVKKRALGLLQELEILPKSRQKVELLSSSEKQRVAIAR